MIYKECWWEEEKFKCLICPLLTLLCNDRTDTNTNRKCRAAKGCARSVYLSFWFLKLWGQISETWVYLLCLVLSDRQHSQCDWKQFWWSLPVFTPCFNSSAAELPSSQQSALGKQARKHFSKNWKYTISYFGTCINKGTNTSCPCVLVLSLTQVITDVCKPN